jgi:glycosyltransferase involved in cell wall biosynthesis
MKILYIYEKMPSTYQQYLLNLLTQVKSSFNVKTLVYSKNNAADYVIKTYGIKDYFQRIFYKLKLTKYKTLDVKVFSKFDIVHLQHSYLFNKFIPLLENSKIPKIVITLRGGDTYVKPWVDNSWRNFYNSSKHIAAFITMSEHQKQYLHDKWGIPLTKIYVTPISFGSFSNAQPKYPNKKRIKLVSAFRMTWEKNIEGTVRFAKKLKEQNIDFEYDIYGDGEDFGQLYYLIDRFDLQNEINLKGKVDNNILKNKLIEYDFFIQLSLSEAFPTSVLEAQSIGLPCIVSNSDGLKEAIIHNKTGISGDYYDLEYFVAETIKLWEDKERYYQFSTEAINFVNKSYTLESEVMRLEKMYNDILKVN